MAEALLASRDAFKQDLRGWVTAGASTPGARRLDNMRVVLVRHLQDSQGARSQLAAAGLPWPDAAGDLQAAGALLVARRQPEEVIVTSDDHAALERVIAALAPGQVVDAMAVDMSHGVGVVELHGPRLDEWLAHLVDASAIPAVGSASRCRLVDIAVVLLRTAPDRVQLIADRALFPYLADWLAFTHEGAFEAA